MQVIQRGNPSILKSIQAQAKKVSQANGLSSTSISTPQPVSIPEAGAFASMQKRNASVGMPQQTIPKPVQRITEASPEKRLKDRLLESVETLGATKEYFNATSSLLTLYAMGALTEGVMDSISREDLREIKGIVREFKNTLDSY
jgi:hypothetical protein